MTFALIRYLMFIWYNIVLPLIMMIYSGHSEFCDVVSKIHIYTQEEVEKMTFGVTSDDQSCLEQAPVSKSSSVGQPDSSPTVIRV